MGSWTFFSNYGNVLVCLARNPDARLRDVALDVGITERAVQKIVRDLQDAEFLTISKQGRRNRYRINRRKSLRHDLVSHVTVGKLLRLVAGSEPAQLIEPDLLTEKERQPETVVEQKVDTVVSPPPKVKKADTREKEPKGPIDTRQQGDLF